MSSFKFPRMRKLPTLPISKCNKSKMLPFDQGNGTCFNKKTTVGS